MTTVTITPPSEQLIKDAVSEAKIKDSRGREITLRKPGVLAQYRFIDGLGDSASNSAYVGMTLPLLYVAAIDGGDVPTPSKKSQLEALIQRLDEDGISAVMTGVQENFGNPNPEADAEAIKKS